jgi:hypothetical protein
MIEATRRTCAHVLAPAAGIVLARGIGMRLTLELLADEMASDASAVCPGLGRARARRIIDDAFRAHGLGPDLHELANILARAAADAVDLGFERDALEDRLSTVFRGRLRLVRLDAELALTDNPSADLARKVRP